MKKSLLKGILATIIGCVVCYFLFFSSDKPSAWDYGFGAIVLCYVSSVILHSYRVSKDEMRSKQENSIEEGGKNEEVIV